MEADKEDAEPQGTAGTQSRGFSLVHTRVFISDSGWWRGLQISDVSGKPGAAPQVPPLSSSKQRFGTSLLPAGVTVWRKELS